MRVWRAPYRSLSFVAFILASNLVVTGCDGGDENAEGEGGADGEGATAWITGEWSGSLQGQEDQNDGSNLVEPTSVEAKFTSDNTKTGSFTFKMTDLDNVEVTGTFSDFAGKTKSLLLKIKDSKYSPIGMPGSTTDLEYTLYGDDLELSNANVILKLIRKESAGDGGGDGDEDGGETPADGFVDDWNCGDQAGRTWKLNLGSENRFAIKVYDVPSPVLTMSGNYTVEDGTVVMTVADSSQSNYEGQLLTAKLESEGTLRLYRMIRTGNDTATAGDSFTCGRE